MPTGNPAPDIVHGAIGAGPHGVDPGTYPSGVGGGGGGGSSIPPGQQPPPFTIDLGGLGATAADTGPPKRTDPEEIAAEKAYLQIWGVEPPKGYIENLMRKGYNLFEIVDHELNKPQVRRTQYYVDKSSSYAQVVAQIFGTR